MTAKKLQPASQNKTILVTGFAPFGGEAVNPSYEAVKELPDNIQGWQIVKAQLPVEYDGGRTELNNLIDTVKPSIILCTGQAGGRRVITPEYVAINLQDSKSADNAEVLRKEQKVSKDGPDAYFSSLPVFEIVRSLQAANIPAQVSYSAGTYVCNTVMYHLMQCIKDKEPQVMGGFIHVPYSCEQVAAKGDDSPSMPTSVMTGALQCVIETCIDSYFQSHNK